jgi:hypothetical protein
MPATPTARAVGGVEQRLVPDRAARLGIRRLLKERLAQGRRALLHARVRAPRRAVRIRRARRGRLDEPPLLLRGMMPGDDLALNFQDDLPRHA